MSVTVDIEDVLRTAQGALATGDTARARATLEAAGAADHPAVHYLLGALLYFDDHYGDARREWELAFRQYRAAGDDRNAARVALQVTHLHANVFGHEAAGEGWLGRARRLLERIGSCVEWGYYELALMACDRPDAVELERSADRALDIAMEFADADLEALALADGGLALVSQGRHREGFGRLDEALAAVSAGEVADLGIAGKVFCAMLSACDRAGEVARAEEWTTLVGEYFVGRLGASPRILYTHCRLAYGSVLCSAGRWGEAEEAILDALGPQGSSSVPHRIELVARLAELRVDQGRLDEAAALLVPYEDRLPACQALARVHLARGELELAAAAARRALKELVGDALRGGPLLALVVEAELRLGDVAAADSAAQALEALAAAAESPVLRAKAAMARGRVAASTGDHHAAVSSFEAVPRLLAGDERPLLAGQARVESARALAAEGEVAAAISEARAALAVFDRLGAWAHADQAAALLRELGASARARPHVAAATAGGLTRREAEVLELIRQGATNAEIASRLYISPKTAEHHVGRVLAKLGVRSRAEAAGLASASAVTTARPK
jgi:DNA-binding CsgD family transcriptional regulator